MVPTALSNPRRRSPGSVSETVQTASRTWRAVPPMWRELLLIAVFYSAYTLTRLVLNDGGTAVAFQNAYEILALERTLGIDIELSLNQALLQASWLALSANYFYGIAHFAVTLIVLVWLYRFRSRHYRWLRTALMAATAAALVGFWLYPLAPPRFLTGEGFVDPVQALGSWGLYSGQSAGTLTNQYAAMPSMHAGWALWCGFALVLLGGRSWVKAIGALYPAVTVLVIIATANHYVVDAVVGVCLVAGALLLTRAAHRHRAPAPPKEPAPAAALVGDAVEDPLHDPAGAAGVPAVVLQQVPGARVAQDAGDGGALPVVVGGQQVGGLAAHQHHGAADAGGQLPGRGEDLPVGGVQQPGLHGRVEGGQGGGGA